MYNKDLKEEVEKVEEKNFSLGYCDDKLRMSAFQGIDKAPALSYAQLQQIEYNSVVCFAGFYLGGPNYMPTDRNTSDNSSISFTSALRDSYASLVYLAYLYVGRSNTEEVKPSTDASIAYSQGQSDALEAASLAASKGVPQDSVIYLDVEGGDFNAFDYVQGWVEKINADTSYWAGVYCSKGVNLGIPTNIINKVNGKANMWIANYKYYKDGESYDNLNESCYLTSSQNPARWYDYAPETELPNLNCVVMQYSANVTIHLNNYIGVVDQDSSRIANPSLKQFSYDA